jgi:hypothetical protein
MIRIPAAAALAAALALAGPALAQGTAARPGGVATQGGPHGSAPGPIAPQLEAAQQSLLNAEQQLSRPAAPTRMPARISSRRAAP